MADTILIRDGTLVTLANENKITKNGAVFIEDNRIIDSGQASNLEKKYDYDRLIDASGKIIMPGLINTHHHLYSTFARGFSVPGKAPENFEEILEKLWWRLDRNLTEETIYYSALISLIECVRKGTTTIIDHHESQSYQEGALDEIAKAVKEIGLRASLCLGASDRYSKGEEGLRENERFLSKLDSNPSELLRGMVGLHASFTINNNTLDKSVEIAKKYKVGVHFHCAEGKVDQEKNVEKYNLRVVERLYNHDALGKNSLAVHGIHLNGDELDILKKTNTNVVHNPESNMNNAVGYADVPEMLKRGIKVGIGTDGMSSDILSQTRCACLLHSHKSRNPRIGFEEATTMLLENNPEIVERVAGWNVGEIRSGALADIILIDYHPPTPFDENTFLGHLIYGLVNGTVDTTICNGEILMHNKELLGIDEESLASRATDVASELWEKIG